MENNQPMKYTVIQVNNQFLGKSESGYLTKRCIPVYIITKCYLNEETTKFSKEGKETKEYKITIPYSIETYADGKNDCNIIVDKIFDNYERAKEYANLLNQKVLLEEISSENQKEKEYYNDKIEQYKELEQYILFPKSINKANYHEVILSTFKGINIANLSEDELRNIYNNEEGLYKEGIYVFSISEYEFKHFKEQINNNDQNVKYAYSGKYLYIDKNSHNLNICNGYYTEDLTLNRKAILTTESYPEIIRKYIDQMNFSSRIVEDLNFKNLTLRKTYNYESNVLSKYENKNNENED